MIETPTQLLTTSLGLLMSLVAALSLPRIGAFSGKLYPSVVVLIAAVSAAWCVAQAEGLGVVSHMLVSLLAITTTLAGSAVCAWVSRQVAQSGMISLPADMKTNLLLIRNTVYGGRVTAVLAIVLPVLGDLASMRTVVTLLAMAIVSGFTFFSLKRRTTWTRQIFELAMTMCQAEHRQSEKPVLVHISKCTRKDKDRLKKLDRLIRSQGENPFYLCRGQKCWTQARSILGTVWLVRKVGDIDRYLDLGFTKAYHLPRGDNGSHVVFVHEGHQVLVDLDQELQNASRLPKHFRMFDVIYTPALPSPGLIEDAAGYGIRLVSYLDEE